MTYTWCFRNKIVFGLGAVNGVAELARKLGIERPLIVTDPGIVKCGLIERVTDPLKKSSIAYALFDQVEANPTEASVFPGVEVYKAQGCDGVIGLGGGSALDAAKAIR